MRAMRPGRLRKRHRSPIQQHDSARARCALPGRRAQCRRCRAERLAAEAAQQEARAAAERDNARARALQQMMDSTLQKELDASSAEELVREPWMDLPLSRMSAAQREALKAFEKRVQERSDSRAAARRKLEAELKNLEDEMGAEVHAVNGDLARLHELHFDACAELAALQRQVLDLATLQQDRTATRALELRQAAAADRSGRRLKEAKATLDAVVATADASYGEFLVRRAARG